MLIIIVVSRNVITPKVIKITRGQSADFKCRSNDDDVVWTFRSNPLPDNVQVGRGGRRRRHRFTLKVIQATIRNAGTYACTSEKDLIVSRGESNLYVDDYRGRIFNV